jgi:hypothetical protein
MLKSTIENAKTVRSKNACCKFLVLLSDTADKNMRRSLGQSFGQSLHLDWGQSDIHSNFEVELAAASKRRSSSKGRWDSASIALVATVT